VHLLKDYQELTVVGDKDYFSRFQYKVRAAIVALWYVQSCVEVYRSFVSSFTFHKDVYDA